jgi:hypothetical protein
VGVALAAAAILFFFDPAQKTFYPVCLFYTVTGLSCPGCGALRASHQLLHGHLAEAFRLNPLLILALPFVAWALVRFAVPEIAGRHLPTPVATRGLLWTSLALVIVFWILRNLPFAPFSWFAL